MSNYCKFADFYDRLTENADYEVRSSYISDFFITEGINGGSLLDLACGTCSMSLPFARKGFRVIGVDNSEEMLSRASEKLSGVADSFTLIRSDMRCLALTEPVDGCICTLDSINHLDSLDDVRRAFVNAYDSLREGGLFVFDVNTIYKHNHILADNTFVFDEEDFFLSWDNECDGNGRVRIMLDFFILNGEHYDRYSEEFFEAAYELNEIHNALSDIGFREIRMFDDLTHNPPSEESERVFFICKR